MMQVEFEKLIGGGINYEDYCIIEKCYYDCYETKQSVADDYKKYGMEFFRALAERKQPPITRTQKNVLMEEMISEFFELGAEGLKLIFSDGTVIATDKVVEFVTDVNNKTAFTKEIQVLSKNYTFRGIVAIVKIL